MKSKKSKVKSKKTVKKKSAVKPKAKAKSKEKVIGKIEHIFGKINVITTTLKNPLKVGDIIHIKGHTTDIVQAVDSIQIEHESVQKAKKGDGIGIKVKGEVRDTDIIYAADKKIIAAIQSRLRPAQASPAFAPVPQVQRSFSPVFGSIAAPKKINVPPLPAAKAVPTQPQAKQFPVQSKPEIKKPEPPRFLSF